MKTKALLAMLATGVLTATAAPAMAEDWITEQLARSDGYAKPVDVAQPNLGAAGRSGQFSTEDAWLDRQLQMTDGYAAPMVTSSPGAAGRSGRFQEPDAWLQGRLQMSDGAY